MGLCILQTFLNTSSRSFFYANVVFAWGKISFLKSKVFNLVLEAFYLAR